MRLEMISVDATKHMINSLNNFIQNFYSEITLLSNKVDHAFTLINWSQYI